MGGVHTHFTFHIYFACVHIIFKQLRKLSSLLRCNKYTCTSGATGKDGKRKRKSVCATKKIWPKNFDSFLNFSSGNSVNQSTQNDRTRKIFHAKCMNGEVTKTLWLSLTHKTIMHMEINRKWFGDRISSFLLAVVYFALIIVDVVAAPFVCWCCFF